MTDKQIDSYHHFHPNHFQNKRVEEEFNTWLASLNRLQISAVSFLTGTLYVIYSLLDHYVAPPQMVPMMTTIHLYLIAPVLFLISLLSFSKKLPELAVTLLLLAPIGASVGNLVIVANVDNPATYLTELYLILFWTFTVSGLRLMQATLSAFSTFTVVFITTFFLFPLPQELFIMHFFWMFSAFSFGLLGAYLLERSNKRVFLNHDQLERLAVTDKLTELFNRTRLDEILQNELDRSQRFGHAFGIVVLDIDHFKNVNDNYGHQVGDAVLVSIAELIKEHLRSTDKAVRWGGEEFIIIYLETNTDELLTLAEELRQKIENHTFEKVGDVTASFGVTLYNNGDTIASIIKRADSALYAAKEKGRNRIEFI
ncbi:GGDEF domain-containing protein [Sulfurimonas sp. HSL3-7]|uniref:GGDEF domain-containing protein n=1 Tax=Sulfonitrofixus jiaomeiensis TaxID=3131938 RepID=UPI0031F96E17